MLTPRSAFVSVTARRRFEFATTDLGAIVVLPGLVAHLLDRRPGVGIDVRVLDPVRSISSGSHATTPRTTTSKRLRRRCA